MKSTHISVSMSEESYRPRLGCSYDDWKQTDNLGDSLLDCPGISHIPPVQMRHPCSLSSFCGLPNFHLGACNHVEHLDLVTVWDPRTGEMYLDPDHEEPQEEIPF